MKAQKKILVVTPIFPFSMKGACDQDRAYGIQILKDLGYEVAVVTMSYNRHIETIAETEKKWGIKITPILLTSERYGRIEKIVHLTKRFFLPRSWDGAANEYRDRETQHIVKEEIERFKPDLVWFDYSYLWPLYHLAKIRKIPIITRSINFEPDHFIGKTKMTFVDRLKYRVKMYGELQMIKLSDAIFPITVKEKLIYEKLGGKTLAVVPLRRLSVFIGKNVLIHNRPKLNVLFMGSTFTVHHMNQALQFILNELNPLLQEQCPDTFTIHIIGAKISPEILMKEYPHVVIHGYVKDLDEFLLDIDIALSPSLSGEGMQQKVFEPIVRGIPTVTSERALVGYPFYNGVHLLTAQDTAQSFVSALVALIPENERARISQNAIEMSKTIFSETLISKTIDWHIKKLIS